MSIATAITRLQGLRNRLVTRLTAWKFNPTDLEDCVDVIESIDGTLSITSTTVQDVIGHGNRYAQVSDANLIPSNIVKNVTILGVTGTAAVDPPSADLTAGVFLYGGDSAPSVLLPPSGYDGFNRIIPELTDANPALKPSNIKSGATVMGVTGTYQTPTEYKAPTLSELVSGGIASQAITVTPSSGKHLSQVTIPRIVKDDGTSIVPTDIRRGKSILGIAGSLPDGKYAYLSVPVTVSSAVGFLSFSDASLSYVPRYIEMYLYQVVDDVTNLRVFHLSGENPNGASTFDATVHCLDGGVYTQAVVNNAIGYTENSNMVSFDITSLSLLKFRGYYQIKIFY